MNSSFASGFPNKPSAHPKWLPLALIAAIGIISARLLIEQYERHRIRTEAWEKAQSLIEESRRTIGTKLDSAVKQPVQEYFHRTFARADAFAGEVLSFSGKWKYAKSKLQSGDKEYAKWIEAELTRTLLDPHEMQDVIKTSAQQYLEEINAEENRLLVKLSQDVFAMPEFASLHMISAEQVKKCFDGSLAEVSKELSKAIGRETGTFVASEIAMMVLSRVIGRLTISGVVIGGGAALSPESLGLTLAAAVVVDYVVTKIWNMFSNPEKEIAEKVKQQLYELRNQVLWGENNKDDDGLLYELNRIATDRDSLRSSAIKNMIFNSTLP